MEISILVLTYNHERFVRQTLDSIIMQKIDVSYEILILDDASADHTPQILKEYKEKYPQIIRLFLRRINSGHSTKNVYYLLSKAKGKYYAFIEGDDYWTDDLKIQKQYNFLREHAEYSGCMTDLIVVDEENNEIEARFYEKKENHIYTLEDFMYLKAPGMTVTFLARNYFNKKEYRIIYEADRQMGDFTSYMLCLLHGNIYQLSDVTSAYRYVCIAGKGNYNSIIQGDRYKNYRDTKYWINLENYMQNYDEAYKIILIVENLKYFASRYPVRAMINLLVRSRHKKKYVCMYLLFLLYSHMQDSEFLLEKAEDNHDSGRCSWNDFKKEKKPIVLFGAGKVAEEYINKYAWKGNILFLVDNDENKQNTSFKGFIIKEPSELLNYKGKIIVLVTNKFYEKEIERQLCKMGVKKYYFYCSMQTKRLRNITAEKILEISDKVK